jgi:hypothetical protein
MRKTIHDIEEGLIGGMIAAVVLICYAISCMGCATTQCPPCVPIVETITIKVPVDACEPPEDLPTLEYPEWPKPPQGASEVAWKAFYADVVATVNARMAILLQRIEAQAIMLNNYRVR